MFKQKTILPQTDVFLFDKWRNRVKTTKFQEAIRIQLLQTLMRIKRLYLMCPTLEGQSGKTEGLEAATTLLLPSFSF